MEIRWHSSDGKTTDGLSVVLTLPKGKNMPDLLRPDAKALVWLALGFFVLPAVVKAVRR